jgi:predicted DNA-binding antitoxin AbrB/MazE fold protein
MTVRAIYEDGVFKPSGPVDLPNNSVVELEATVVAPMDANDGDQQEQADKDIYEILSRHYHTGQTDTAERHNEHQP